MAVPELKEFYLPTLKFFEDKQIHKRKDTAEYAANYLNLSEDELTEKTQSGRFKYKTRSIFAVEHLYNATLLEKVNTGEYKISEEGLKVLNENLDFIDTDFLMKYDSFKEYVNKYKNIHSENVENKERLFKGHINEIRILPMSNRVSCCETYNQAIDFLSNRIITENNCRYFFKRKFNFSGNTLILFQYEGGLIAAGVFTNCVEEKHGDYEGYFVLDKDSIRIFNKKITLEELNNYVNVTGFSQVKRIIELKNLEKIYQMIKDFSSNFEGDIGDIEYEVPVCVIKKYLNENVLGNMSNEELESSLLKFQSMFSPEILKNLEGIEILNSIFPHDSNHSTLCYNLESGEDFRSFGGISGGSNFKFSLCKYQNEWTVGINYNNLKSVNESEAIEIATKIRDAIVEGADYIKNNSLDSVDDYIALEKELNNIFKDAQNYCPIKPTHVWIHKYYALIFPDKFNRIHSETMKIDFLHKFRIEPQKGYYAKDAQFMQLARKSGIKLYSLFDEQIIKLFFDGNEIWDSIDKGNLVDLGDCDELKRALLIDKERNLIYFGAPGTGKSFNLNKDKDDLLGEEFKDNYERVTFHPDYSYANFVGVYKPVPDEDKKGDPIISYEYVPGPFMRLLVKALDKPEERFLLIIEEINRANVAAVFGDVFQLLDRKDNVSRYDIQLSKDMKDHMCEKLGKEYDRIKIPQNMFIWATMNSADQGVFPMDSAFKRRWDFRYIGINEQSEKVSKLKVNGISWNTIREAINKMLLANKINEDKLLGPFFAFSEYVPDDNEIKEDINIDEKEFNRVFKNKILMYLFEDVAKPMRNDLFEGAKGDKDYVTYSEICDKYDEIGFNIFHSTISDEIYGNDGE